MVTDGLSALALSLETPEPDVTCRRPCRPDESILSPGLELAIAVQGLLVGLVELAAFGFMYLRHDGIKRARATTFCVLVCVELMRVLAARSSTRTFGQLGVFSKPLLLLAIVVSGMLQVSVAVVPLEQRVFDVPAHTPVEWTIIAWLPLTPVTLLELGKLVRQSFRTDMTI